MKKIKLFAPVLGASLTCIAALPVVGCAPVEDNAIQVLLNKDVTCITLKCDKTKPVKGDDLVITLTADEGYTIVPTSIKALAGEYKIQYTTEMSKDNTVATIKIKGSFVDDDIIVYAEAKASEEGEVHSYLSDDGKFVAYTPTHEQYNPDKKFDNETQVLDQYLTDVINDNSIIVDDYLYECSNIFGMLYKQIQSYSGTVEKAEASIEIENLVNQEKMWKFTGHVYRKIVATIPSYGEMTMFTDTKFTNAYIDTVGVYSGENIRRIRCNYVNDLQETGGEKLNLTDWVVEGEKQDEGETTPTKETFNYKNWEYQEVINPTLTSLCSVLAIDNPHYMQLVPFIEV